jgi:hypothetical protein
MDIEEISLIYKEKAKEVFNKQEDKYSRRRKYTGFYCCSEDEVERFEEIFQELLENKEEVDYEYFSNLFEEDLENDY